MNDKELSLIEWCWNNLEFTNNAENWQDTIIIDILNNYDGIAKTKDGEKITYSKIRSMFLV